MVNFAGTMPRDEANGLAPHSRRFVEALASGERFVIVAVVGTASIRTKADDLVPVPTLALQQVELLDAESGFERVGLDLLQQARSVRRGGAGQQEFAFDDEGETVDAVVVPELSASPGYSFKISDVSPGRFEFALCTQHVEGVVKRSGLIYDEFADFLEPGTFLLHELPGSLRGLGEVLIAQWESNSGDAVVDAEIVDGEEE